MLNDAIRKYRKRLDLSQEELARRVGCKRVSIAHYEAGTVTPPLATLKALARAFKVSLDTLVKDDTPAYTATEEALDHV